METGTPTVLITGATSGIGYELSKLFAKEHYRIIAVSHEAATLHNVSEVLKTLGSPKVITICRNFTHEKAAEEVYQEVQGAGLKLDILVNSAFAGQAGKFADVPAQKDLEFIHQNISTPMVLSKFFIKEMLASGSGKVLHLLPFSLYDLGFQPAGAAAAKSFVLSFTDSLIKELKDTPISVSALVAGLKSSSVYGPGGLVTIELSVDEADDPSALARIAFNAVFRQPLQKVEGIPVQAANDGIQPGAPLGEQFNIQLS